MMAERPLDRLADVERGIDRLHDRIDRLEERIGRVQANQVIAFKALLALMVAVLGQIIVILATR